MVYSIFEEIKNGLLIFIVCDKFLSEKKIPSLNQITISMKNELISKISYRYIDSLIKKANIIIN